MTGPPRRNWSFNKDLPKSRRLAAERLIHHRIAGEFDKGTDWDVREKIPEAWMTFEQDVDVQEPKVKVTLYLDDSVAKFFPAQSTGWHARANRVLATYAQVMIADVRVEDALLARAKAAMAHGD
ncbi:MAG: BrnA antitoxin family protein [Pseudomonadota bacterium]